MLTYDCMAITYDRMSLDLLLGGPARRAILARTYLAPEQEFYLRELVRLTGLAVRSVQVELDRMVGAGFLRERRDGNRRYVQADTRHPLFAPVRDIILKTDGLADVLRGALGTAGIHRAIVYGSIASGVASATSDVDVLIIGSLGLREAVHRLRAAQDTLGREINASVWTVEEFERRRTNADPFLARVLAGATIPILP